MGFHNFFIALNFGCGNSQTLQLGIHQNPGTGTYTAVQDGNIFPSQVRPAFDILGIALLDIEALGPVADIHQYRGNPRHQAADIRSIIVKAVKQVAGRHMDIVLIQRQQPFKAV